MFALAPPHNGGKHLHPGTLGIPLHRVHHLVHGLLADLPAALGAVGHTGPGPEQAQVVVDLRHRAHGGAGVAAGGLLVDGDGRGQALNGVHIRLLHLAQELPCVGGKALHIAPLAFRIDGVKGQRALTGARKPREHHQAVPGNGEVDIFQVVHPRAADGQLFVHGYLAAFCVRMPGELAQHTTFPGGLQCEHRFFPGIRRLYPPLSPALLRRTDPPVPSPCTRSCSHAIMTTDSEQQQLEAT